MAHLKKPNLSDASSGSIAKLLTYSKSKNVQSLKLWRSPRDTKTNKQLSVRALTGWISSNWKAIPKAYQDTWEPLAAPDLIANYHAYVRFNARRWRHFIPPSLAYPPAETPPNPIAPFLFTANKYHHIDFGVYYAWTPMPLGFALFMSDTSGFTHSFNNAVLLFTRAAGVTTYTSLYDLTPGTYYFRVLPFSSSGAWGNVSAEIAGTSLA